MSTGMVQMIDGNAKSTLYDDLVAAGLDPKPASGFGSDLHVPDSDEARRIFEKHGQRILLFVSNIDGKLWLEAPFQWTAFWLVRK
jgi:hypothetical protein